MDAKRKEEFKRRFSEFDDDSLIENGMRPLTEEAGVATRELLEERGLVGDALDLRINAVRKEIVSRSGVTNQCDYCGESTAFGSLRSAGQRFCSERCRDHSALLLKSIDLAPDLIIEHAMQIKFGECPQCGVAGRDVEMRYAHHLIGALVLTHSARKGELRCRTCARRANLWAATGCLLFGWWSLPGLFLTPVFIIRNLRAARSRRIEAAPSEELLMRARLELARIMPDFSALTIAGQDAASERRHGA